MMVQTCQRAGKYRICFSLIHIVWSTFNRLFPINSLPDSLSSLCSQSYLPRRQHSHCFMVSNHYCSLSPHTLLLSARLSLVTQDATFVQQNHSACTVWTGQKRCGCPKADRSIQNSDRGLNLAPSWLLFSIQSVTVPGSRWL